MGIGKSETLGTEGGYKLEFGGLVYRGGKLEINFIRRGRCTLDWLRQSSGCATADPLFRPREAKDNTSRLSPKFLIFSDASRSSGVLLTPEFTKETQTRTPRSARDSTTCCGFPVLTYRNFVS